MRTMTSRPILLVEDTEDDEILTLRAFRQAGIANPVVVARDGVQALDYLFASGEHAEREAGGNPAIVLLDLNLPRLGGLDVLARIRGDARTRLVPVIILTSSRQDEDVVRSYAGGANSYVRKPVLFAEFAEAMKHLGLYWLVVNEAPPDGQAAQP